MEYERKIYSQNGEDGVIQHIFNKIGIKYKSYIEFGVENGQECNTRYLREIGWDGMMFDGGNENINIKLYKKYITFDNIIHIMKQYNVKKKIDFLSIDLDYNNYYILLNILHHKYKPRVICTETISWLKGDRCVVYDPYYSWSYCKSTYVGASSEAYINLLDKYGYHTIYIDSTGTNLFAVRYKYKSYFNLNYNTTIDPPIWSKKDYMHRYFINPSPDLKYISVIKKIIKYVDSLKYELIEIIKKHKLLKNWKEFDKNKNIFIIKHNKYSKNNKKIFHTLIMNRFCLYAKKYIIFKHK